MKKIPLGKTGMFIGPLAFGGNVFGWTIDQAASFKVLDAFVAGGFNLIDTADVYSRWAKGNQGGESETIIGNWLKQRGSRDSVIIATKVGKEMAPENKGLSAKYIRAAVEQSLKRLQTDYIDLYQSHDDDINTAMEETLGTFTDLIKEGKVRAIGASNFSAGRLKHALDVSQAHGYARYQTLQPLYNLCERDAYEKDLEPLCIEQEIGVINYYALASGFLTGKYRSEGDLSKSPRGQGVKKYLNAKGMAILKALDQTASRYHSSPAAVSIAWLLARPSVTAPIASATTVQQVEELLAATSLNLDRTAIDLLNAASQ